MSDQLPWSDTYVSGRSRPSRSRGRSPPLNKTACRVVVSDKVSWSDTPTFHNTLVVGSSPTSSTTQSPTTGEILPICELRGGLGSARVKFRRRRCLRTRAFSQLACQYLKSANSAG